MAAKKSVKETTTKDVSKTILGKQLKDKKDDHLNFQKRVDWTCSTGSLLFDVELGGGLKPGCVVCGGASFAGKSSFVAQSLKNFLENIENTKGFWVKAEGRLDDDFIERSGIKFVYTAEEWEVGTCFVLESNIFDIIGDTINALVASNPDNIKYAFIVDSIDALISKEDFKKSTNESHKIGSQAVFTKVMLKKANLSMTKLGHIMFLIKQVSATITAQNGPIDQNSSVGVGGPNSLTHFANQVMRFNPRWKNNYITHNGKKDGKTVGHYCQITLSKGVKETPDVIVRYPVKHGRKGGKSVWIEIEIIKQLEAQWGWIIRAGSWFSFAPEYVAALKKDGIEVDPDFKIQGESSLRKWFEDNPEVSKWTYGFLLRIMEPQCIVDEDELEDFTVNEN